MPPDEGIGLFNSYRPNFCSTVVNALSIPGDDFVDVGFSGDQGRAEGQGVVEFAEGARSLADEHASLLGGADHRVGDGFSNGFLRGAILHDFDTGEQALAANVADDGMLRHQALEAFEEAVAIFVQFSSRFSRSMISMLARAAAGPEVQPPKVEMSRK